MTQKKIDKLTPEQELAMPRYVREFTQHGLSTEPADRHRAERAIHQMYACGGLVSPKRIVWCGSPLALVQKRPESLLVQDSSATATVDKLLAKMGVQSPETPEKNATTSGSIKPAAVGDCVFGQHDANWLAFYAFMREVLGLVEQTEKLTGLTELCKSAGWALPYENTCYVAERHCKVIRDNAGRLHNLTGAAVEYPDGWGVYAVRGTRVPKEWVVNRDKLDPTIALTHQNMDQRAAAALLIGWDRVLDKLNPKVIDKDPDPSIGSLLQVDLPDEPNARFLRAKCGTGRDVVIRVPPTMTSALQSGAWSYGLEPKDYCLEVRT